MGRKRVRLEEPRRLGPVTRSQTYLTDPLNNPLILQNIFQFLDLNGVKECRLVNNKWNVAAEPFLRKLAKITFTDFTDCVDLRNPTMLEKTFENCTTMVPFNAFRIRTVGMIDTDVFFGFLSPRKNIITDLTLYNIAVGKYCGQVDQVTNVDSLIGDNLRKLEVVFNISLKWNIAISTTALQSVSDLTLVGSILNIEPGQPKIVPKNIYLKNVKFFQYGLRVNKPMVNNFVDFEFSEKIHLQDDLVFDIGHEFNAESLELIDAGVRNWSRARGSIQSIKWHHYRFPILGNQYLNLKSMFILTSFDVDLGVLPPTLEELTVSMCYSIDCSTDLSLPNLKVLVIKCFRSQEFPVYYFIGCPKLTNVTLICYHGDELDEPQLYFSSLPRNLDKLTLTGDFSMALDCVNPVNSLCIRHSSIKISTLSKILKCLMPKHVLYATIQESCGRYVHMILDPKALSFAFGPISWSGCNFHASPLSRQSHQKGEYYFFKGKKGKIMSKDKFFKLMETW